MGIRKNNRRPRKTNRRVRKTNHRVSKTYRRVNKTNRRVRKTNRRVRKTNHRLRKTNRTVSKTNKVVLNKRSKNIKKRIFNYRGGMYPRRLPPLTLNSNLHGKSGIETRMKTEEEMNIKTSGELPQRREARLQRHEARLQRRETSLKRGDPDIEQRRRLRADPSKWQQWAQLANTVTTPVSVVTDSVAPADTLNWEDSHLKTVDTIVDESAEEDNLRTFYSELLYNIFEIPYSGKFKERKLSPEHSGDQSSEDHIRLDQYSPQSIMCKLEKLNEKFLNLELTVDNLKAIFFSVKDNYQLGFTLFYLLYALIHNNFGEDDHDEREYAKGNELIQMLGLGSYCKDYLLGTYAELKGILNTNAAEREKWFREFIKSRNYVNLDTLQTRLEDIKSDIKKLDITADLMQRIEGRMTQIDSIFDGHAINLSTAFMQAMVNDLLIFFNNTEGKILAKKEEDVSDRTIDRHRLFGCLNYKTWLSNFGTNDQPPTSVIADIDHINGNITRMGSILDSRFKNAKQSIIELFKGLIDECINSGYLQIT